MMAVYIVIRNCLPIGQFQVRKHAEDFVKEHGGEIVIEYATAQEYYNTIFDDPYPWV